MAKCKALTGSAVKGLTLSFLHFSEDCGICNAPENTTVTGCGSPQLNRCIFDSRQNSSRVSSESHRWRGKVFQSHGPTTVKDQMPRLMWVCRTLLSIMRLTDGDCSVDAGSNHFKHSLRRNFALCAAVLLDVARRFLFMTKCCVC